MMMNSNIASVERALDILLLLYGEGKEMGVSEIANQLGVYKSIGYAAIETLCTKK
jgi:DNA-binding IclR family transcriptional regulator